MVVIVRRLKKLLTHLKKITPWVVACIIFYFLFKRYPITRLLAATHDSNLLFLISFSVTYFFYIWWMDCWSLARILTRFDIPTKTREVFQGRATSYLVMLLNYAVGQGSLSYFISQRQKTPFLKVTSTILFISVIDLYWVISFAFVGSLLIPPVVSGISLSTPIRTLWILTTAGLLTVSLLAHLKLADRFSWLQNWSLFHVLRHGHVRHYLATLLERLPMHIAINTCLFFVAWGFHSIIPLGRILSAVPVVILAGTIPITPGGLGTVQVATVALLKDAITSPAITAKKITAEELLFSISLFWLFANYSLKALFGFSWLVFRKDPPQ